MKSSLIAFTISRSDYHAYYSLYARIGMRIFSWIFPGILRIYITKD